MEALADVLHAAGGVHVVPPASQLRAEDLVDGRFDGMTSTQFLDAPLHTLRNACDRVFRGDHGREANTGHFGRNRVGTYSVWAQTSRRPRTNTGTSAGTTRAACYPSARSAEKARQVGPPGHAKLVVYALQAVADGPHGQLQLGRDVAVGVSRRGQQRGLTLGVGQPHP